MLWAHYSDKHKGICIGFEISDEANVARRVHYVSERQPFPRPLTLADVHVGETLLFTKYDKWQYEQEIRCFLKLDEQEGGLYFRQFDGLLRPFIVIAGARCILSKNDIDQALGPLVRTIAVIKARPGFRNFEIVEDKRGFSKARGAHS